MYSGRDVTLGLTLGDLREILEVLEEDVVTFEVTGRGTPVVYRSPSYMHLLFPTSLDNIRAQAGLAEPPLFTNDAWIQEISTDPIS
ncbi:MAG: hypothetical protein ACYC4R_11405 [Anaerolineae bacterium]